LSLRTRSAHQSVRRLPGQFDAPGYPGLGAIYTIFNRSQAAYWTFLSSPPE
jgi:hypothetical protein